MTPPKKAKSNTGSHSSSTRSAKPSLVLPGEFKRGGGPPQVESHDRAPPPDPPAIQASFSRGTSGEQPRVHDTPQGPGDHDAQHKQPGKRAKQPPKGPKLPSTKQPLEGPKPPSSLCTPRGASASTSGKRPSATGSGSSSTPTGPERSNEGKKELSNVNLQQTVPNEPDFSGGLPGNQSIAGPQSRKSAPLTLYQASGMLKHMFSEIEKVVNGNSRQVLSHTTSALTSLVKSVHKDVSTPVSNNAHLLKDIISDNFKAVKFSLAGISTISNSISTSISTSVAPISETIRTMGTRLDDLEEALEWVKLDSPVKKLAKTERNLKEFVQNALDITVSDLGSRKPSDPKLIHEMQGISARLFKLESHILKLSATVMAKPSAASFPDDLVRDLMERLEAGFKQLQGALLQKTHAASDSTLGEEVEQKLEEQSESQRIDF
ncbi:hypothetical protein PTTG_27719 [Puccinia triticina 1-1 BBBD Race 1]|uniref:Uncharacterized protein n=1 Tax=Puccinia triticina (isolate 1-1 / race 1 (BBBD)) TaxID=630390 RepID=A0A180GIE2_PUCT1|nr:hypothetical protein PTTG_27719 [Puccinia triticina 1-1 BBBD Race 1]